MPINKTDLLTDLTAIISDYTAGSTVPSDVLLNVLSIKNLNENNIIVVDDYSNLPNLKYYVSPSGMVYFIQNKYIFAISSGTKWLTLDGKLIRQDSTVNIAYAWGYNQTNQLGDGTANVSKSSPVSVVGGITDWCQVSAGGCHSLGLRKNGTAWGWGSALCGRLGDNTIVAKCSPVSVVGGFTDWCQVSAGFTHSLGVRTNGTAWAWGNGANGMLGDNNATNRSSPVVVLGGFTDWRQVAGGGCHSIGVRTNGTAWAWGCNGLGALGDNSVIAKSSPVSVVGGFTDWCRVGAGCTHSIGIRTNCTIWAWGSNGSGQLGDNTTVSKSSPVSVIGGFTDWCQIATGATHNLALRTNGTLWGWGANTQGQLGDNSSIPKSSPVSVVGGFTDWCHISTGRSLSGGVRTNGTAWTWGCNTSGQLGDCTTTSKSSPVSVVGGFTDWYQLSSGSSYGFHTLGIRIL